MNLWEPIIFYVDDFVGTPALTSRQFKEEDFRKVVDFIDTGVEIALEAQNKTGLLHNIHQFVILNISNISCDQKPQTFQFENFTCVIVVKVHWPICSDF